MYGNCSRVSCFVDVIHLIYVVYGISMSQTSPLVPEESVYGKRDGYLHGLAIVSKAAGKSEGKTLFHGTRGYKTGTILGVEMCQRQDMWKPQAGEGDRKSTVEHG